MRIFLTILRGLFVLIMAGIGWNFVADNKASSGMSAMAVAIALTIGVLAVCIDILAPSRRKLSLFAGTFFGLTVGVLAGYALSFVVALVINQLLFNSTLSAEQRLNVVAFAQLLAYCATTYFSISFVMQTKDDFRFIIPYVEFRRQMRGSRPLLLDTSVLIDGRIATIIGTGIFESQMIVPRFVLQELQTVADSADRLKRNRGRRGLEVLAKLQQSARSDLITYDTPTDLKEPVDQRLISLAQELEGRLITTDYNLQKVAQLAGIDVVNINELAAKMKPEVLPGERMSVRIIKPGEGPHQGVGYLDDGTMVVIEQGRAHLNEEIEFTVTNSVQTTAGKMIFGRAAGSPDAATARRDRSDKPVQT